MNMSEQFHKDYEMIQELAAIRAPSGLETQRSEHYISLMQKTIPNKDPLVDSLGNVIFRLPFGIKQSDNSSNPQKQPLKIAIIGHIDEIGATISKINPDGTLLMQKRGGFESRWVISRKVQILALSGEWIDGVVLGRTTHAIPPKERAKPNPEINELKIFIGAESSAQVKEWGIHVGAPMVFAGETSALNPEKNTDIIMSNSLDNIGSLVIIRKLAEVLEANPLDFKREVQIDLVAAVREEIGREGALFYGRNHKPDIAVAIDFAVIENEKGAIDCGGNLREGPFIVWSEAQGREIFDYSLCKEFIDAAAESQIPIQNGVFEYYGSDSGMLQKMLGIRSVLIGYSLLGGHNIPELVSHNNLLQTANLIYAWLTKIGNA